MDGRAVGGDGGLAAALGAALVRPLPLGPGGNGVGDDERALDTERDLDLVTGPGAAGALLVAERLVALGAPEVAAGGPVVGGALDVAVVEDDDAVLLDLGGEDEGS